MHDRNFFEVLRAGYAVRHGDPFLVSPDGPAVSYGAMDEQSARLAGVLRAAGVNADDRVLVQVPKSVDAVALYLATLRLGAVYVPINPAYTAAETAHFVADAEPRLIVGEPAAQSEATPLDNLVAEAAATEPVEGATPRSSGDLAALIYTSGTTGRPKGAMLTHRNLAVNARAIHQAWGWRDEDVLLHALPIFHVHGLFVALHCAMLSGSAVHFFDRFDVPAVRNGLKSATVMMGVPTFYHRLLADPQFGESDAASMRLFVSGSAPLSALVHQEFARRTGHRILERYGMSEAGMICTNPLEGERVAGTVGFPFAGYDVRVADETDRELPAGDIGVLQIRGPSLFAGYWRNDDATDASFTTDGWFRTGDSASVDAEGRVTLHGRTSDLIISGGFNIYPKEIELALDEMPGVAESAVVGVPDPDLGELVAAFVVRDDRVTGEELRSALRDRIASFKQPRRYVFVEELPRNAMGKVQKAQLRNSG